MATLIGFGRPLAILLLSASLPCAGCKAPPAATAGAKGAPATSGSAEQALSIVDASVVVGECPDDKWMNAKMARDAIRKLVDPCAAVPGGRAHFSATLQPNGDVKLASPAGDTAEGVVPTCVLQNKLQHKVNLKNPCKFDVKLEERAGAAPAASTP